MKMILVLMATAMVFSSCVPPAATKRAAPEPVPPPNYSFAPPSTAAPRSAEVTLALVQPRWAGEQKNENLLAFGTHLKNDFIALLTARGFTTRGPFESWELMLYPDKTGSDLVLTPELAIEWSYSNLETHDATGWGDVFSLSTDKFYTVNGTLTIRGQVNLVLTESMTNERMWMKSITIDPIQVPWHGEERFSSQKQGKPTLRTVGDLVLNDPGFQRVLYPKLNEMYRAVLRSSWDYLDPRELRMVKAQAAKLKKD